METLHSSDRDCLLTRGHSVGLWRLAVPGQGFANSLVGRHLCLASGGRERYEGCQGFVKNDLRETEVRERKRRRKG